MKKNTFFLLCFQLLLAPTLFAQQNGVNIKPKIFAVVVGVSNYNDSEIPDLKYAEKDAVAFYDFLRSENAGSVPEDNIALLTGTKATRSNILNEVIDKFTRSTKEDLVIFYFSGHGKAGEFENTGYLLNYDAVYGNEGGSALSMDEVKSKIDKCQAKMKISYIDACHAGLFKTSSKGSLEEDNSTIVSAYLEGISRAGGGNISFLASSARQQSTESDKFGHGIFTYYLLEGLKGAADMEQEGAEDYNNGIVNSGELATYLINKIQTATKYKQKPAIEGDPDGFFPLSVLRANISIANEIAKRPQIKIKAVEIKKEKLEEKQEEKPCNSNVGDYCFSNKSIYKALIYLDQTGGLASDEVALTISAGENECLMDIKEGVHFVTIVFSDGSVKGIKTKQIRIEKCIKTPNPVSISN